VRLVPKRARARLADAARTATAKVFPGHWSFLLGELALFSFIVLVVSGLYLALFYEASAAPVVYDGSYEAMAGVQVPAAYASVLDISFDRPAGLIARQVHHWAALVFVASLVAHAARVFFTGAFRRPRRLNWMIGVTLLGLALANGFFGLALPHDLLGGTGTRIGNAFATSIPVVGPGMASVVFGGEFPAPGMLHRLWQLHVIVLPLALGSLLAAHLGLVFAQSHTQHAGRRQREANVVGSAAWPGYALKTMGLFALVVAVLLALGALVEIAPVWLYGPFEPGSVTVPAQPDWYLGWVEGALRTLPGLDVRIGPWEVPSPFFAGIALPVLVFGVLYAWPFLEERATGDRADHHLLDRPRDRPVRTALGVAGLALLGVLLAAGSHDLQGLLFGVSVDVMTDAYRVLALALPPLAGFVTWRVCRDLARSPDEPRPGLLGPVPEPEDGADAEPSPRQEVGR
jgi:ubiquinol-cytochrome c reductase cytochrome b subunit